MEELDNSLVYSFGVERGVNIVDDTGDVFGEEVTDFSPVAT